MTSRDNLITCCPNPSFRVDESNPFLYHWSKKDTRFSKTPYTWLNPKPHCVKALWVPAHYIISGQAGPEALSRREGYGISEHQGNPFFP